MTVSEKVNAHLLYSYPAFSCPRVLTPEHPVLLFFATSRVCFILGRTVFSILSHFCSFSRSVSIVSLTTYQ